MKVVAFLRESWKAQRAPGCRDGRHEFDALQPVHCRRGPIILNDKEVEVGTPRCLGTPEGTCREDRHIGTTADCACGPQRASEFTHSLFGCVPPRIHETLDPVVT